MKQLNTSEIKLINGGIIEGGCIPFPKFPFINQK